MLFQGGQALNRYGKKPTTTQKNIIKLYRLKRSAYCGPIDPSDRKKIFMEALLLAKPFRTF